MFGELTLLVILQGAALIAAGAAAGYFIAMQRFDKQRDKLRDELDVARDELKEHREQVDSHFLKTGLLFNQLTDSYREIYEHLATGAQNLCSTEVTKVQLDQPETRVLPVAGETFAEDKAADEAALTADADSSTAAAEANAPDDVRDEVKAAAEDTAEDSNATPAENVEKEPAAADVKADEESPAVKEASSSETEDMPEKPAAADIAAIDEKTADDEHIGADAAPAPTLAQDENVAAKVAIDKDSPANIDQHKSPPSIH